MANRVDNSWMRQVNDRFEQPWMKGSTQALTGLFGGREFAEAVTGDEPINTPEQFANVGKTWWNRITTQTALGAVPMAGSVARSAGYNSESGQSFKQGVQQAGGNEAAAEQASNFGAALDTFEDAQTIFNTGLSTGIITANAANNALQRALGNQYAQGPMDQMLNDGFQVDDVRDVWDKTWEGEVTPGRAISFTFGRNYMNIADWVTGGRTQKAVNDWIIKSNREALDDPENTRGLLAWNSGLHSEFDIYDKYQADSAFNQGIGRWITGTADAAVLWWAAPDIVVAKGAGLVGRKLLTKSIDSLGDVNKAGAELAQHRAWKRGDKTVVFDGVEYKAKRTSIGRLSDSLTDISDETVAVEHDFAKLSSNKTLVARVITEAKTPEQMDLGIRALMGDMLAVREARGQFSESVMDGFTLTAERNERLANYLRMANEASTGNSAKKLQAMKNERDEIERLNKVIEEERARSAELDELMTPANQASFSTTGISAVRFGTAGRRQALRLSRFEAGRNAPKNLASSAARRAEVKSGKLFSERSFTTIGGRSMRVFRAGADYVRTYRAMGRVNIARNGDELYDEIASIFGTNPIFRRIQRLAPEERGLRAVNERGQFTTGDAIDVDAVRNYWLNRAVQASSATERLKVAEGFQSAMLDLMRAEYGLSARQARNIFQKYKDKRKDIDEKVDTYGWFKDGDEIIAVPDLQSRMAETVEIMDFDFIETIFRLERGAVGSQSFRKKKGMTGDHVLGEGNVGDKLRLSYESGVLAKVDAIWRPLVLMRLGYTQRNVVEGMLRELAAYGSLGFMSDRDKAIRLDPNMSRMERVGYRANQFSNALTPGFLPFSYKAKVKKLTKEIAKQQEELQALAGDLRAREAAKDRAIALQEKLAGDAEVQARKNLTEAAVDRAEHHAGVTWERADDLARGEAGELMDSATDIYIPAGFVQPLYVSAGKRRSKSVSGYAGEDEVAPGLAAIDAEGRFDSLDDYMGYDGELPYAQLARHLSTQQERDRLAQVIYAEPGTPEYEEYLDFVADASLNAMRRAYKSGKSVVRHKGNGGYEVIQDMEAVTMDDLLMGRISVLPSENYQHVEFVRAKIYGGILDLRLLDEAQPAENFLYSPEFMGDFMPLHNASHPEMDDILLEEAEAVLDILEADPEFMQAFQLGMAIDRMAVDAPHILELAEKKGLLSASKAFKKAKDRKRKTSDSLKIAREEWYRNRDDFLNAMYDPEFVNALPELADMGYVMGQTDTITFHGSGGIPGDRITEVPMTEYNVQSLHGGAMLYTTGAPWAGAEYAILKNVDDSGNVKLYLVSKPYEDRNFIDMDAGFNNPETGLPNPDVVEQADMWLEEVLRLEGMDTNIEDAADEIGWIMEQLNTGHIANNPGADPLPLNLGLYREALEEWLLRVREGADPYEGMVASVDRGLEARYAAQETIRQAALDMGAVGLRHKGGQRIASPVRGFEEHPVYIFYVEPEIIPIESLTPEMMRLATINRRYEQAQRTFSRNADVEAAYRSFAPYDVSKWDAAEMSPRTIDVLTDLAHEAGYGGVMVSDTFAPTGRRMLTRPDNMSVGTDENIDDVIPGEMLEQDYIDRVFPELQRAELLADSAVYRGKDRDTLMAWIGNKEAVRFITRGGDPKKLSPQARAALVRAMEGGPNGANRYTHITVGPDEKIFSASQLMGGKKSFGAAYGAMLEKSDVEQESARLLKSSRAWHEATSDVQETTKEFNGIKGQFDDQTVALEELAAQMRKLTFKRNKRKNPNRGFGMERFVARGGYAAQDVEGPFMDSMYASLASSENRNRMMVFGLADIHYRELQRGSKMHEFTPGEEYYFLKVSEQLNNYYRRDPFSEILLQRPELRNDDVFAESLPDIIAELQTTQRGRAWLRDQGGVEEFKGLVDQEILRDGAFDNAYEAADRIRMDLMDMLPDDDDLWRRIGEGDVDATELMGLAGWRSDWGSVKDFEMIMNNERWYRKAIGKTMRTLGTVPEDHMIRHPFFRARWREDMTRQMDLYGAQKRKLDPNWDGFFSQDELNQMSLVSRQYALKSVQETLYTIQRLSTPAHMMKFISPFFPAWASTMRFWTVRMPLQKPENVVRYGMVFDAPARMGMMEDREGNKLEGGMGTTGVMKKFMSDDDNMIVIQTSGKSAEWLSKITGGQTRLGISRGSLDMMLQGDTFWLPGFGPLITMSVGALAGWNPATAEWFKNGAVMHDEDGQFAGAVQALTKAVYDSTLPFGPSKEKSPTDVAIEAFAPGMAANLFKRIRGTDSASFSNTAVSIYRDDINDWELNGRQGPQPEMRDAVAKAQTFYLWRIAFSGTLPFAPSFSSENTFYVNEWRAIEQETYDNGGNYTDAMDEFIGRYGAEYFAYTQSLSGGSSGVSAKAGEFEEVTGNMNLYGNLANIGDDASYMTMASRGVADWSYSDDGFDPAVYAWQFNRSIEGASGKFFRSGSNQRTDMLQDIDKQAGWYYYDKMLTPYKLLYENGEIEEDVYRLIKDQVVYQIGNQYPTWFEVYGQNSNERYIQSAKALRMILSDEQWVSQHGETDYARSLFVFQSWRDSIIQELRRRDAAGGSDSIDAKSNADLALMYQSMVSEVGQMDPSGEAARTIDRFFGENDALVPIPGVDY